MYHFHRQRTSIGPGNLKESATGNQNSLCRITQLQVYVISLSGTDILRSFGYKIEVCTKLTVFHFRIRFSHFQFIGSSVTGKVGRKSGKYPFYVVLVYLCLYFKVGSDDLPDMFAGSNGLADLASRLPTCPSMGAFTFRFSTRSRTRARLRFILRMFHRDYEPDSP